MKNNLLLALLILIFSVSLFAQSTPIKVYYPGSGYDWAKKKPGEVGIDADLLKQAITYAQEQESDSPRDLEKAHYLSFGREPFGDGIGPYKTRGEQTGIVIRNGYIVAEWGEPKRVDMTFSVTKTFLSSSVGLAYDRGLISDIHDPVHIYMAPVVPFQTPAGDKADRLGQPKVLPIFESEHNRKITWDHLLRQTSSWQGVLWGKPDWADRPSGDPNEWLNGKRAEPGTAYEYNDVRVNLLALAAMNIWRRPLPQVLREHLMDPIGATPTWRWHGYENSWIVLDGQPMQAVSGGGHWGGGMFINAYDQARLGYLTLRRGQWKGKTILSEDWVKRALTPTPVQKDYGFMNWFLNTDRELLPSAPETAFAHLGAGVNMVYVDPENDLVIVVRWIKRSARDGVIQRVLASIK